MNKADIDFFIEEKARKEFDTLRNLKLLVLVLLCVLIALIVMYWDFVSENIFGNKLLFLCIFLAGFFGFYILRWLLSWYYKKNIIAKAIEFLNVKLEYFPGGDLLLDLLKDSCLFGDRTYEYLRFHGKDASCSMEDLFAGEDVNGYSITFCDTEFSIGSGKRSKDYNGSTTAIQLHNVLSCTVVIKTPCKGIAVDESLKLMSEMDIFSVYTDDAQTAGKLVTPELIKSLRGFYDIMDEILPHKMFFRKPRDIAFSIFKNMLVVYIPDTDDMYETTLFTSQKESARRDFGFIMNELTLVDVAKQIDDIKEYAGIGLPIDEESDCDSPMDEDADCDSSIKEESVSNKNTDDSIVADEDENKDENKNKNKKKTAGADNTQTASIGIDKIIIIVVIYILVVLAIVYVKNTDNGISSYNDEYRNGVKYEKKNGTYYFFDETEDEKYWVLGIKDCRAKPGETRSKMYLVPTYEFPVKCEENRLFGRRFTYIIYKSQDKTPGDIYAGMTQNGRQEGYGILYRSDGARIEGYWHGRFVCDSCLFTKDDRRICTYYEQKAACADTISYPVRVKFNTGRISIRLWRGTRTVDVISKDDLAKNGEEYTKTMDEFDKRTNMCLRNNRKRHNELYEILTVLFAKNKSWM